jgi:hypothetical protein
MTQAPDATNAIQANRHVIVPSRNESFFNDLARLGPPVLRVLRRVLIRMHLLDAMRVLVCSNHEGVPPCANAN